MMSTPEDQIVHPKFVPTNVRMYGAGKEPPPAHAVEGENAEEKIRSVDGQVDDATQREAKARAEACMAEIDAVLTRHHCVILTRIRATPMAQGSAAVVQSLWAVAPKVEEDRVITPQRPRLVQP